MFLDEAKWDIQFQHRSKITEKKPSFAISRPKVWSKQSYFVSHWGRSIKRQKQYLGWLFEVLARGSTSGKSCSASSMINEPNKAEVQVRHFDIEKCRTKEEKSTILAHYAERRPSTINEKTLHRKITNHKKDLSKKIR